MQDDHAIVHLTKPIPALVMTTGSVGTVVMIMYDYPSRAYDLEFRDDCGTSALITLTADQLRPAFDPASD